MLRTLVSSVLKHLPSGAPTFIYTVILRPAPLRWLANRLLRRLIPARLALPEGMMVLNREDPVVSGALALGVYEPGSITCWRGLLSRPDMNVLDVGANIGLYSLIAAGRCPKGRVLAFEPEPRNAEILTDMARRNGFTHLTLIAAGAGACAGSARLFLDPDNKGKHSLVVDGVGQRETVIPLVSVDEAVAQQGVSRIDAVKIDVEGWEAQVLLGMATVLARDHPALLFELAPVRIRAAGDDPEVMLQRLMSDGYRLAVVNEADGTGEPIGDVPTFLARFAHRNAYCNILASWTKPSGT